MKELKSCPVCQNISFQKFITAKDYTVSRETFDLVKCDSCGLVRSDPVASPEFLAALYAQSTFDYGKQVNNLRITYGYYLATLADYGVQKASLLEIGSGNGFFLEEALRQGFTDVWGIEPSKSAVAIADPKLRPHLVCDVMRPRIFNSGQFDVICMFQVFDHIPDPATLLDECFNVLKPKGLILCFNHNVDAASAHLMKARSPIIDIEHTYLYNPSTLKRIFIDHRFDVKYVGPAQNTYDLYYLYRLLPLPKLLKQGGLTFLNGTQLGNIQLRLSLGNLYLIAQKPPMANE